MDFIKNNPSRKFKVGLKKIVELSDVGKIKLLTDEIITFITESGKEYDLGRKSWGFYATPSINSRLKKEGFKTALVKNTQNRYYIMLVEKEKVDEFFSYIYEDQQEVIEWLDERK